MGTNCNVRALVIPTHRITPASSASSGTKVAILALDPICNQEQLPEKWGQIYYFLSEHGNEQKNNSRLENLERDKMNPN